MNLGKRARLARDLGWAMLVTPVMVGSVAVLTTVTVSAVVVAASLVAATPRKEQGA